MERKPSWLKVKLTDTGKYNSVMKILERHKLETVCSGANCPNRIHCYSQKTAAFLIMGPNCTRHCRFCNIKADPVRSIDSQEPERVAEAIMEMSLDYVVITSVSRDDLEDGGAGMFARTIDSIRKKNPAVKVEVLIPDFQGNPIALGTVIDSKPDVLNHNVETVERLYKDVRPEADYSRSLQVLKTAKNLAPETVTKSGFMLGLGEKEEEVDRLLEDLRRHDVDLVTIGQYLPPSKDHYPLAGYIEPGVFEKWRIKAEKMGFKGVQSGPMVRSSYHAKELSC